MPITAVDNRLSCLGEVWLYDKGQGDPFMLDKGTVRYDNLSKTWEGGLSSYREGLPVLEYLEDIGLVCRPWCNLKDTRHADFTFHDADDWVEQRPIGGGSRNFRLSFINGIGNIDWHATSNYTLPANPHFAISFAAAESPADQDFEDNPPWFRFELGNGKWAIEFSKQFGPRLLMWYGGQWILAKDLQDPDDLVGGDLSERLLFIRCLRGKIGISGNFGRSYQWFEFPDKQTPANIPAGKLTVRGNGGIFAFGIHQLEYFTGTYDSVPYNTFVNRFLAWSVDFTYSRYSDAFGTGVEFSDLSEPLARTMRYRATLRPKATASSLPFKFFYTPELYATQMTLPVTLAGNSGSYTVFEEDRLERVTLDKPNDISSSRCTLFLRHPDDTQWALDGRWRKMAVRLREQEADGSLGDWFIWVGYVAPHSVSQGAEPNAKQVQITLEGASARAKDMKWNSIQGVCPLGGRTVNAALDFCINRMGLTSSYRSWNAAGDLIELPPGQPEDPTFYPQPGQPIWETMRDIAGYAGMELAVTDQGVYETGPMNYVEPTVTRTWEPDPSDELLRLAEEVELSYDPTEHFTGVVRSAKDEVGNTFFAFGIDYEAETNPASPRFSSWSTIDEEELQDVVSHAALNHRLFCDFYNQVPPKVRGRITAPVDLFIRRRQRVQILNTKVGALDTDHFVVLNQGIEWLPIAAEAKIQVGVMRL